MVNTLETIRSLQILKRFSLLCSPKKLEVAERWFILQREESG